MWSYSPDNGPNFVLESKDGTRSSPSFSYSSLEEI